MALFWLGVNTDVDVLLTALASVLADGPSDEYELEAGHWQVVNDTRSRSAWAPELAPAAATTAVPADRPGAQRHLLPGPAIDRV